MFAPTENALELVVEQVLRSLRINGRLKGMQYLIYAITETVRDPARTKLITKDLYPKIARLYGSTASRVERDIRSAIRISWVYAQEELEQVAGYHLLKRPTNGEFIDFVAFYIRSK